MRGSTTSRRLALLGLGIFLTLGASANINATAAQIPQGAPNIAPVGDHNSTGNGRYNINAVSVRTFSKVKGVQIVSQANAGGRNHTNNAFCPRRHHCRIHQRAR